MTGHLGYKKHHPAGQGRGTAGTGTSAKTVLTDIGAVDLAVLPDRNGTFEPKIVRKGQAGWPDQRADHRAVCAGRDDQHRVGVADRRAPAAATRHGWNPCSPDSVLPWRVRRSSSSRSGPTIEMDI